MSRLPPSGFQVAFQFGDEQPPQAFGVLPLLLLGGIGGVFGTRVPVSPRLHFPIQAGEMAAFQDSDAFEKCSSVWK